MEQDAEVGTVERTIIRKQGDLDWDLRWLPDDDGWDEYTELVATLADEEFPTAVPLDPKWPLDVVSRIVLAVIEDSDMRRMMLRLLEVTGDDASPSGGDAS